MKNIIKKFKDINILIIGDLILDKYIWGTAERLSPEAPVPVVKLEEIIDLPGGATNVALNVKKLGGNPIIAGVRGYTEIDPNGYKLINLLSKNDISNQYILTIDNWKTPVKTRIVAHNQQIVRVDNEPKNLTNHSKDFLQLIKTYILKDKNIHCAIISDYVKNTLDSEMIKSLIIMLKEKHIPIIVDTKRKKWECFENIDIITPNLTELRNITSLDLETSIPDLLDLRKINNMLLTMGEKGMRFYSRTRSDYQSFKTTAKQVYDVTGAGDTVVATLSLGLGCKLSYPEAIYLSNIAAGIVVGKFGTSTVTVEELNKNLLGV